MAEPRKKSSDTAPLDDRASGIRDTDEPQGSVGSEGCTSPMDSPSRPTVSPHAPDSPTDDAEP